MKYKEDFMMSSDESEALTFFRQMFSSFGNFEPDSIEISKAIFNGRFVVKHIFVDKEYAVTYTPESPVSLNEVIKVDEIAFTKKLAEVMHKNLALPYEERNKNILAMAWNKDCTDVEIKEIT